MDRESVVSVVYGEGGSVCLLVYIYVICSVKNIVNKNISNAFRTSVHDNRLTIIFEVLKQLLYSILDGKDIDNYQCDTDPEFIILKVRDMRGPKVCIEYL